MTDKEKAKAYDEALRKIQPLYEQAKKDDNPIWSTYEYIFPELAESEDERIIKTLQEYVKNQNWPLNGPTQTKVLAWLEKQKELPFVKDVILGYPGIYFYDGERMHFRGNPAMEEKQKEQKPTGKPSREEYLNQLFIDQLITFSDYEYLVEKKPAEWTLPKDFEEAVYKVANFISPFDSQEELRKVSHRFAEQLLSLAKKELDKPAEWSEDIIQKAIKEVGLTQHQIDWFKTNIFPPKQEWSEEDEDMIRDIIASIDTKIPASDFQEMENWLKSLRPSWKPSEDDIKMLEHIIGQYETGNKNSKVRGYLPRVEELNFLKKVFEIWKN